MKKLKLENVEFPYKKTNWLKEEYFNMPDLSLKTQIPYSD